MTRRRRTNPILGILRWLWRNSPATRDALMAKLRQVMVANPYLAAKFYPYQADRASYLIEPTRPRRETGSELAVPPKQLWWGYAETEERYLAIGRDLVETMQEVLQASGTPLSSYKRILDFGCGSGIMIRWLRDCAGSGEVWGVDISGECMLWCEQHLAPPFKFATTTSFPHLPFEDRYFDFVYAGSVFTHIADLAEAWLLELRRIVRPAGRLYLTVQDERSIELLMNEGHNPTLADQLRAYEKEVHFTRAAYEFFTINRTPGPGGPGEAQVFYHSDYLRRHWGQYLRVVSVTQERYSNQTAMLLEK
jgi:ubiquinone/menaquinone biosynthesis C-methylase UbiE